MTKISVSVSDATSQKPVFEKLNFETKDSVAAVKKFSLKYPDCFVTLIESGKKTVFPPHNMAKDQALVDSGKMSLSSFIKKWHPGKSARKRDVQAELIEEFGEEETI